MNHQVPIAKDELIAWCRRYHVRKLALFGSAARGEDREGSDLDFLVEFEPGRAPGLIALAGMELELSELAGGRAVDLRTPQELSRYFRDEVLAAAELQYAA